MKMHHALTVVGANLLAMSASHADGQVLQPHYATEGSAKQVQAMSEAQMRGIEASHLEVFAGCKWGHAAFDPVIIESEVVSAEVQAIHQQLV